MKAERVVCDTNVLISAAISTKGKPRQVLSYIRAYGRLLVSTEAMIELATRLEWRKFDKYLSADARRDFINSLLSCIDFVALKGDLRVVRDPDDDKILETAIIGRADCLVTGDKDLLALRPIGETGEARSVADATCQDVAIVRPAEFLALVEPPGARTP